jgi:hypothetical protein
MEQISPSSLAKQAQPHPARAKRGKKPLLPSRGAGNTAFPNFPDKRVKKVKKVKKEYLMCKVSNRTRE